MIDVVILFGSGVPAAEFVHFLVGHEQPPISVSIQTNPSDAQVSCELLPDGTHSGTVTPSVVTEKNFSFLSDVSAAGVRLTTGSREPNPPVGYTIRVRATHPDHQDLEVNFPISQTISAVVRQEYVDFGLDVPALERVGVAESTANFTAVEFSQFCNYHADQIVVNGGMQDVAQGVRDGY